MSCHRVNGLWHGLSLRQVLEGRIDQECRNHGDVCRAQSHVWSSCDCGLPALESRDFQIVPPQVGVPCPKTDDPRRVFGSGNIIDPIEIDCPIHSVGDSVIHFCDGNVVGFVLFALVGEVFLKEIEAGIVAKSETRFAGIAIGQECEDVTIQFVIFTVFSIGSFVL